MARQYGPSPDGRPCSGNVFFGFVFLLLVAQSASAQVSPPRTEQERDREYAALARDVDELERHASILKRVVKIVRPAVVHIEVRKNPAPIAVDGRRPPPDETGSGVIFTHQNRQYVLSNRHLIKGAEMSQIVITLSDGRELKPSKAWSDSGTDVAVLAVSGKDLKSARLGDSDKAEIGDFVLAIGSPFGLSHTVTYGIVSAKKGRRDLELSTEGVYFQDFMQIDASINPGNSGGPLVNLRGEVIGINTAIASTSGKNEGIGFTIPIKMAMIVARQLIESGVVRRGFLGVKLDSRFSAAKAEKIGLDRPRGARINEVTAGSPADRGNVKAGDVILKLDNTWIDDDSHLVNQVSLTKIGSTVTMLVYRDGKTVELNVEIGDRRRLP